MWDSPWPRGGGPCTCLSASPTERQARHRVKAACCTRRGHVLITTSCTHALFVGL